MKVKTGIEEQPLGEGLLVYDKDRDKVLMLNRTAAFIYKRVKSGHDVEHVTHALEKAFSTRAGDDLISDIKATLAHLAGEGIIAEGEKVKL